MDAAIARGRRDLSVSDCLSFALMRDLRARCEWDAAQTHDSLRPYLIEEASELDEAIQHYTEADMEKFFNVKGTKVIGLFAQKDAEVEEPKADDIYRVGTAGQIGAHAHLREEPMYGR